MGIEDSIVLIKSKGERSDIGTGFIIYQDETASYVLTCAHVVKAIGNESVRVDTYDAKVIAYGFEPREEGLDLAVLRAEGLKKSALNLWTFPKKGDFFRTHGYYDFDNKGTRRRDSIEGKLEKQGFRRINGEDIKDWDLLVTGSDMLKPGCSGAPVLNQQNEVIAVVTHELSNGQRGAAVSIEALEKLENWEIDIRSHLHIPRSASNVDYRKLHDLLAASDWKAADQETYRVMIRAVGKKEGDRFTSDELSNFPCTDLKTIDSLWVKYSNGHFGFSVQKKIWQECGSPGSSGKEWDRFCVRVGWQNEQATAYLSDSSFKFDLKKSSSFKFDLKKSPKGELPTNGRSSWVWWGFFLFSRTETCRL